MKEEPSLRNLTKRDFGLPPETQNKLLQDAARAHVESFNYMLREGLHKAAQCIPPVEMELPNGQRVSFTVRDAVIKAPTVAEGNAYANTMKVYPVECRERGVTYRGKCQIQLVWTVDGQRFGPYERVIGEVPIMVRSSVCNLDGLSPKQLVARGEEAEEFGGYFIINGNERLIRQLIMPRRHFPNAINRPSWKNRGSLYTEFGVQMRCVTPDQTGVNLVVHYLNNGTANVCFSYKKEQFFVPVVLVLKALVDVPDKFIFQELMKGKEDNSFYKGCIANMLRQAQAEGLCTQKQILKYMGERFRIKLYLPEWKTDAEIASVLFHECICVHQDNNMDKFNTIVYMTRKVFAFAKGECCAESADNPAFQEVLLGGHLYMMLLKEKIENWLLSLRASIDKYSKKRGSDYTVDMGEIANASRHCSEVTRPMEYLLATGNLVSRTGLGLMQASGLTIVADKLNFYRYLSHFRSIHRGAFFAEMRTTAVRKLLPEAWGFLCPVHTPDGSPCGLLNHLTASCQVVNQKYKTEHLQRILLDLGMHAYDACLPGSVAEYYTVMQDGTMLGWVLKTDAEAIVEALRRMKVKGLQGVPQTMEIVLVASTEVASQYPGIFLFTSLARMLRPVTNLAQARVELIGSFEQVYMNIAIIPEEAIPGLTTHLELSEQTMLSVLANFTPFSDFNQSPRNMYQCQMGKQTMGTPCHALAHRSDNKLYRIQTPQTPIVRPVAHDNYMVDNYPLGTNAVVAVISYTGYDMEDAMILSKSAYERGFGHGSVYKSEFVDLKEEGDGGRGGSPVIFGTKTKIEGLEDDGLPSIGTFLTQGAPYYSSINTETGVVKVAKYKSQEPAYVDQIKVCGDDLGKDKMQRVCFVLRIVRNPIIGDKFASRHGQKGICSQKWPVENMPFTESGMTPDILFNPHGFPSRMTIGMMIESMAGKSAAMHGLVHDATPFTFSEDHSAVDHFGQLLTKSGYNYYGTERMYSGVDGREFEADIFCGIVYYQRLRHMVSDKFQVRTTGPIDQVTHQPVKGRKRHGGVRFGEMERDGLLSHGTSFLLQDRLFNNSDRCVTNVCTKCGSILSPLMERPASESAAASYERKRQWTCVVCADPRSVEQIAVPYVFRYMTAELAAMNIKVSLDVRQA